MQIANAVGLARRQIELQIECNEFRPWRIESYVKFEKMGCRAGVWV